MSNYRDFVRSRTSKNFNRFSISPESFEELMYDMSYFGEVLDAFKKQTWYFDHENSVVGFSREMEESAAQLFHASVGLVTESIELLEVISRLTKEPEFDGKHVIEEIGDLRFYLEMALDALSISMESVEESNRNKLSVRYKKQFTTEEADNRDLEAERGAL